LQLQHGGISAVLSLLRAFLVQMTAPAPHTTGRLLALSPDMAVFLAVVTLCEINLSFYAFTPTAIWQRLVSLNVSKDF
jgi:hypothetical protein